jgi:hypothetical protein
MIITEKNKQKVIGVCTKYYNSMNSKGEPPTYFTKKDYDIVDTICELCKDKYKNQLVENLTDTEKKYLDVFCPELSKVKTIRF